MNTNDEQGNIPLIRFETELFNIGSWTVLKLPKSESLKLPSRALIMIEGTFNGLPFKTVLEPDGLGSHWFKVEDTLLKNTQSSAGDTVSLEIRTTKDWILPEVPEDLKKALQSVPEANFLWTEITPNSQWDWIRWINATRNPETRQKRIEVTCSKLKKGMRRPCCFNRNICTEPYVSKNWVLLEPRQPQVA